MSESNCIVAVYSVCMVIVVMILILVVLMLIREMYGPFKQPKSKEDLNND